VPELPEVETVRTVLSRDITGKKIKTVAITNGRVVRRHKSVKEFRDLVEGHAVRSVGRLGKYLVCTMDDGKKMVIHLGMSGQLLKAKSAKDPKPKHTHVVFTFTAGNQLRYVDPRTFGELFISTGPIEGQPAEVSRFARLSIGGDGLATRLAVPELAHLGLDFIEDQVGWDRFAAILKSRSTPIKVLLTDQEIIAGIGNIYADETLYAAGVRFDRNSDSLSTIEIRRLHRAITEILADAIKHRGSTLADEQFIDPDGKPGEYQLSHQVYGREGLPCNQCRAPILRVLYKQRATFYCERCQN
jgi:formamidopyrimidine-DNA glycosylase